MSSSLRMIPFITSLSFFMESLDSTIINTAIPAMSRSLQVNPIDLKIALISYLISLAIFIPISGWLADKFGTKRIFMLSITIFTLSSLWCGFSHSLPELIAARFAQGMGGALGMPIARLIILRNFQREQIIVIMSRVIMMGALGMMLGPLLGGIITYHFSWNWIFWVNVPVGMIGWGLAYYFLPAMGPQPVPSLDKWGFLLFGFALAGFTIGMSSVSETRISHGVGLTIMGLSTLLMIGYWQHSKHNKNPIVRISLLRFRTFKISVLGNLVSRLSFGGIPFLLPLLLQVGLGYTPQMSGLLVAPIALGVVLIKPLTLPILQKLGYKRLLTINTVVVGLFLWLFILIQQSTPIYWISALTFIFGFLISLQYSSISSLAYADLPPDGLSAATSIMSTVQQLSQSFGVAICAIFIQIFGSLTSSHHYMLTPIVFHYTFFALGIVTLLSTLVFFQMKAEDGNQMLSNKIGN